MVVFSVFSFLFAFLWLCVCVCVCVGGSAFFLLLVNSHIYISGKNHWLVPSSKARDCKVVGEETDARSDWLCEEKAQFTIVPLLAKPLMMT